MSVNNTAPRSSRARLSIFLRTKDMTALRKYSTEMREAAAPGPLSTSGATPTKPVAIIER